MANTYTGIKRDATFDITVGGNTLVSLQKLILYIVSDKTEEEIEEAQKSIMKQEYPEDWIEHYAFLALMIYQLEKTAADKGLTVIEDLDATPQGGSPLDQSLLQPE